MECAFAAACLRNAVSRSVAAMLPAPRNAAGSRFRLYRTGRWRVNRRPATLPAQPMTQPRGEPRTDPRSPLACRAAASGSTSSPQGFLPAHQPRRTLGTARRNPRRGNPPPRRAPSAGPHAPPRSPGRRLQPAEPPHPHRVTPRGGKQHRIRDDPVVRSPDGSRQIPRAVSVDHHPRARAPGRTVRPPRHVPDLPARELPLQLAPALTVPHAVCLHGEQDAHLRAVVYLPPAHDVAFASCHSARTTRPLAPPGYGAMRASGRPGQMPSASWPARSPIASRRAGPATSRPGRPCPYRVTNTTRRYRSSGQGVVDDVVQRLRGTVRAHRPDRGHRPDAHLRPAASADDPGLVCGPLQRTTPYRSRQLRPPRPDHPVADLPQERIKRRPIPRRPHQRIRAGRIKAKVSTSGRVLAPHRVSLAYLSSGRLRRAHLGTRMLTLAAPVAWRTPAHVTDGDGWPW